MQYLIIALLALMVACSEDITGGGSMTIEKDDNNTMQTATPLNIGDAVSMKIFPRSDTDFYKVELPAGKLLRVQTNGVPSIIDLYVEVQDAEGTRLTSNGSTTGKDCNFWYNAKAGTYWIMLKDGFNSDSSKTAFSFSVIADTVDTFEYNNERKFAAPINLDSIYCARIVPVSDVDYYKFVVATNSILRIKVDSISSRLNPYVYVYDSEGTQLKYFGLLQGETAIDTGYSFQAGTYYVSLSHSSWGTRTGDSDKPYRLQLSRYLQDTVEWNNDTGAFFSQCRLSSSNRLHMTT